LVPLSPKANSVSDLSSGKIGFKSPFVLLIDSETSNTMAPIATSNLKNFKPNEIRADNISKFDPNFTQNVIDAMGPKTKPRVRKLMASLIQHVHDFARENELTIEEWMEGVQLMNWAGKMSDDKRNEGQLVCDVIGLES
jgi:catechol 1,2-dioxygenase